MSLLIGLLGIAFLFGVAVTIHEFGHFAFAKFFGVRVERFSIGMGKVLVARQWGETEYALSALPVGGYVKLAGPVSKELEEEGEVLDAKDRVEELEAIQKFRENPKARFSKGFAVQMLLAAGLGALGWFHSNPYAAFTMAGVGLGLAAWGALGRSQFHAEIDGWDDAKLEKELAEARERAQRLEEASQASGQAGELEKALPGVTGMSAEEEQLASSLIEDNIALRNKPFHAKFLIFVAGCVMNILLAYFVMAAMLAVGFSDDVPPTLHIEAPQADNPLARYGLRDRDLIVSINGEKPEDWDGFEAALGEAFQAKKGVDLELERDGEAVAVSIPWTPLDQDSFEAPAGMDEAEAEAFYKGPAYRFLLRDMAYDAPIQVGGVFPNSPAEKGGLRLHDKVLALGGEEIKTWRRFVEIVEANPGEELRVKIERGGKVSEILVTPEAKENGQGRFGIFRGFSKTKTDRLPLGTALVQAGAEVKARSFNYIKGLWRLVSGQVYQPLKQLGGALTIGHVAHKAANEGLQNFLNLFVTLNLILAIMNLLPIPLLDGGHILFSAIESATGRPISARVLLGIYNVSFYFIIVLAVFLLGNDVYQNSWRYFNWVAGIFDSMV